MNKDRHYYKMKTRLERAETWAKDFMENEKQKVLREIVTQSLVRHSQIH